MGWITAEPYSWPLTLICTLQTFDTIDPHRREPLNLYSKPASGGIGGYVKAVSAVTGSEIRRKIFLLRSCGESRPPSPPGLLATAFFGGGEPIGLKSVR